MFNEVFGSDEQRALLRRGRAMADLTREDPRYSYYGRTVLLSTPEDGDIDQLAALCRLQGYSSYSCVPVADIDAVKQGLDTRGLAAMHYLRWEGSNTALVAAGAILAEHTLPTDLRLVRLDANTPADVMTSLAEMCLGCGVLPASGDVLRGLMFPAVCLVAMDDARRVVSCAASARYAHPGHPTLGRQAWWGMLATDPARRGERLALILGAMAMQGMEQTSGLGNFMTGVVSGNTASEAVCKRLGLAPSGQAIVGAADPMSLTSGQMTK